MVAWIWIWINSNDTYQWTSLITHTQVDNQDPYTVHLTMQKQRWHLNTQLFFTTTYVQQRNFDKSRSTFGCSVSVVVRFVCWKLALFCHGQHCLNAETKLNDSNMVASCRKQLKYWKFTKSDLGVHCSIHLRPTVSVHPVYNVFGPLQANTRRSSVRNTHSHSGLCMGLSNQ